MHTRLAVHMVWAGVTLAGLCQAAWVAIRVWGGAETRDAVSVILALCGPVATLFGIFALRIKELNGARSDHPFRADEPDAPSERRK